MSTPLNPHRMFRLDDDIYPMCRFLWHPVEFRWVVEAYKELQRKLAPEPLILGVDTETTGLNLMMDSIIVFSVYTPHPVTIPQLGIYNRDVSFVVPGPELSCFETIDMFIPLLTDESIIKVGHNLNGYDYFLFRNHGLKMVDPIHDTLIMLWWLNENEKRRDLKYSFTKYFHRRMTPYSEHGSLDIRDWKFEDMEEYAGLDAFAHYALWQEVKSQLEEMPTYSGMDGWTFYTELFVPFQRVLRNMMSRGIQIDIEFLNSLAGEILAAREELQKWFNQRWIMLQHERKMFYISDGEVKDELRRAAKGKEPKVTGPRPINLNSIPQLRYLFFNLLNKKVLKRTKPGATGEQGPSLNDEVLEAYEEEGCEYAIKLREYRTYDKLYNTYIGDAPDEPGDPDSRHKERAGFRSKLHKGRVFGQFKLGPVTGRLASSNPNLQPGGCKTSLTAGNPQSPYATTKRAIVVVNA